MTCPRCLADGVPDGSIFCPKCGTPLVARAPDRRAAGSAPVLGLPRPRPGPEAWAQRVSPLVYIEGNDVPRSGGHATLFVALAFGFVGAGVWLVMSSQPSSANWSPAPPAALSPVRPAPVVDSSPHDMPPVAVSPAVSRPPPRAPAPASRRAPTPAGKPVTAPPAASLPVEPAPDPAFLSVSTWPWGTLSLDSRPLGDTPLLELPVPAGTHRVRIERDGFQPFERVITLAPGQHLKLSGIALEERPR